MIFPGQNCIAKIIYGKPDRCYVQKVRLEEDSGHECWLYLDLPLAAFCDKLGLGCGSLLVRLTNLPNVLPDTAWASKPLYHLIDHLTGGHREFRERDLPSIAALFDSNDLPAYPQGYLVKLLMHGFNYFREEFIRHMDAGMKIE